MRIDRFLSDMGYGTRSEIKKMIRSGRVYFCDKVCKDPGMKVAETDVLMVVPDGNLKKRGVVKASADDGSADMDMENQDGFVVKYEPYQYFLLNKPVGVVSAVTDPIHQTVVDICKGYGVRDDIFPIGRLDLDTEGLLLLSNDGKLSHDLLTPGKHVEKEYEAVLEHPAEETLAELFESGIDVPASEKGNDAFTALPAKLEICSEDRLTVRITINEGKYHQVKRMFETVGNRVVHLKRLRMGNLVLPENLQSGKYIKIDKDRLLEML